MKNLFFCVLTILVLAGCDMDSDSDFGKLESTYTSEDCVIRDYRKHNWLTGEVVLTTVSDCYGIRDVTKTVIH